MSAASEERAPTAADYFPLPADQRVYQAAHRAMITGHVESDVWSEAPEGRFGELYTEGDRPLMEEAWELTRSHREDLAGARQGVVRALHAAPNRPSVMDLLRAS